MGMLDAPKQNWQLYEAKCRDAHTQWLRSLTPETAWEMYQSLFAFAASQIDGSAGWERLQQHRWEEKLAIRQRMVAAFANLDLWKLEQLREPND